MTERLSERDTEVIRLLARGFTYQEIWAQLGLGPNTLEAYRSRSVRKLDLSCLAGSVSDALRMVGWRRESPTDPTPRYSSVSLTGAVAGYGELDTAGPASGCSLRDNRDDYLNLFGR